MIVIKLDIAAINRHFADCGCGCPHARADLEIVVEAGAISRLPEFLREHHVRQICVAVDENTYAAAGENVCKLLHVAGIAANVCMFRANELGDIAADSAAILQLLLGVEDDTDMLVAVGSGTIHDIVRFVAAKTGKPFLSVPTAASVDGFTSAGAPLIVNGVKKTVQAVPPIAVFADLDVLAKAPRALAAAGFGDMLGKFTSLADWLVSRDLGNEPFCPTAYQMTRKALLHCVDKVKDIASGSAQGLKALMDALLLSGISMLVIGHSRPASGGEHHISHMWEMQCLQMRLPQLLHGAKVGVAAVLLADLYRNLGTRGDERAFAAYADLAAGAQLAELLRTVGGPVSPQQLGISRERVLTAMREGPDLRDRATGLKYIRDHHPEWLEGAIS
ncbi:MAG TPA: sn-glycerol-1-phosphate dehydrogenase [Bacilli bacterium]